MCATLGSTNTGTTKAAALMAGYATEWVDAGGLANVSPVR